MVFNANIPQPADKLNNSQAQLLGNNGQLDTSFGTDHYPFSDLTANNGFHKKVTTVDQGNHASTTTSPVFYGTVGATNTGVMQFSRGPSNAVPTPVTCLQSPSSASAIASLGTLNVLDFTGMTISIAVLYAYDSVLLLKQVAYVFWNGSTFTVSNTLPIGGQLQMQGAGNILQIRNNSGAGANNVYWTLQFLRIQT